MTRVRALVVAVAVATGAAVAADEKAFDAAKLAGTWKLTEGTKGGEKADVAGLKEGAVFTKDTITLKNDMGTFKFKYSVDAKASPATIDLEITEPEGFKGTKSQGLVKLDGDTLTLIYATEPDAKRPTKFESTKENKYYLWVLKKAEK